MGTSSKFLSSLLVIALLGSIAFFGFSIDERFTTTFISYGNMVSRFGDNATDLMRKFETFTGLGIISEVRALSCPLLDYNAFTPKALKEKIKGTVGIRVIKLSLPSSHFITTSLGLEDDRSYKSVVLYFYAGSYSMVPNKSDAPHNFTTAALATVKAHTKQPHFTIWYKGTHFDYTDRFTDVVCKREGDLISFSFVFVDANGQHHDYDYKFDVSEVEVTGSL